MGTMSSSVFGKIPRRRMPTAAFIVGFGALLIACIVLTVGVFNYESGAEERAASATATTASSTSTTTTSTTPPVTKVTGSDGSVTWSREPKPAPPETSLDNVNASIRNHLIADAETARTYTGVAVTGTLTEEAMADQTELTGHVTRLLEQNCVDSMALTAPDNTRLTFTGFCYYSLPAHIVQRMLTYALDGKADVIEFSHYPTRGGTNRVTLMWYTDSATSAERIQETWNPLRRPRPIDEIRLYTYTPDEVTRVIKSRGHGDVKKVDPLTSGEQ